MVEILHSRPYLCVRWRCLACTGLLLAGLGTSACHKMVPPPPRAFIPPVIAKPDPLQASPVTLETPPEIAWNLEILPDPVLPESVPTFTPPPSPRPNRPPAAVSVKPPVTPDAPTPTPPKLIVQTLTADQVRETNRELDNHLSYAKTALERLAGRNLTPALKQDAANIQNFVKQAEQAREQDLLTAVSLARRADLLAKDLLERLP